MNKLEEIERLKPGQIIDRYWKTLQALRRFEKLNEAVDDSYSDDVIIRCEVTVADIRAVIDCLYPSKEH